MAIHGFTHALRLSEVNGRKDLPACHGIYVLLRREPEVEVESAMRQVWGAAWKVAQVQLEAERAALGTARKDIERERAEMLTEIGRLDGDLDEAREEARKMAEGLRVEHGAHEQTRAEAREARAIAEERDKRIASQEAELHEVRRQTEAAGGKVARLGAELVHAQADLEAARDEARKEADACAALSWFPRGPWERA